MNRYCTFLVLVLVSAVPARHSPAIAQPAQGAASSFERVRELTSTRFNQTKLTGDPDKDFSELLAATYEQLVYLAKTQLEYGADQQLRDMAQLLQDETRTRIDRLKQWQVRRQQVDYKARVDQVVHGTGPLDRHAQASGTPREMPASPSAQAAPSAPPTPPPASPNLPLVAATVESVDAPQGKVTLDHSAIPNLNMDAMTMSWRVQDPATLKQFKKGDKVRFSADRVNGQLTIIKLEKAGGRK